MYINWRAFLQILQNMISPVTQTLDDNYLDDEALWAAIDSAAAVSSSALTSATKSLKPLTNNNNSRYHSPKIQFPIISKIHSSTPISSNTNPKKHSMIENEVFQVERSNDERPMKITRFCRSETTSPLAMVKHVQQTPSTPSSYTSEFQIQSPVNCLSDCSVMTHSLSGRFPTVSVFKEYQNAAIAILEKSDYTMISGNPFIKKSGWRKISFYFNISYEIKDKTIEFDDNRNVQRAEFIVRAHMQGGRFSDGWGSCERREKRFVKPNHDIPSTAETRAKNKACQDLLGIGEYRPGVNAQR